MGTTYGLKLGPDGDLFWSGGVLQQLTDPLDAVRQLLETRLRLARGEWFLDREEGTPYYQAILGKPTSEMAIRQALRERILGTPGVRELVSLSISYDGRSRSVSITYEATADLGKISGTLEVG